MFTQITSIAGEDNSSKDYDLSRMIAALMKPGLSNFHATIIAVGGADAMRAADSMRTEIAKYKYGRDKN